MRDRSSSAFDDLHAAHASAVLRLVWMLGVPSTGREDEDVAQEVWTTVFRNLGTLGVQNPRAWIGAITRNAVRTWRRTRRRRPELAAHADEAEEPLDLRTPETATEEERRRHALRAFVFAAIPDEDRREAFVLHEVFGLTVGEVAETTGVPVKTAQARLKMARRDVERTKRALSEDDREALRAVVVPFASVDAILEDLRAPAPPEQVARVRERVAERIEREGTGADPHAGGDAAQGSPPPGAPAAAAVGYTHTGGQIVAGLAGAFIVGTIAGAAAFHAVLGRGTPDETAIALPVPATPMSVDEGAAQSLPSTITTTAPSPSAGASAGGAWEASVLLVRMRSALHTSPLQALALAEEHVRRFPGRNVAEREEVAIRALVQVGRRRDAEARAAQLVQLVPKARASMEALLGRALP